jgi:hypothetical protein
MTKLSNLTSLFEMTAAELRLLRFEEMLEVRIERFARGEPTSAAIELADARTRDYDRAAERHQLWLARRLGSFCGEAT